MSTSQNVAANLRLLTPRDAAHTLAICERTLWERTQPRGPIPVVRIGRAVRYAVADLEVWIDGQKRSEGDGHG